MTPTRASQTTTSRPTTSATNKSEDLRRSDHHRQLPPQPPATWNKGEEDEKNQICSETDLKKKEDNRSEKRRKNQKVCLCFSCFAGHRWRGKEEGRKSFQIHPSTGFSCGSVWTRRQWLPRMEKTCVHCSHRPRGSSTLFLHIPEGFGFFWGLFCNFLNFCYFGTWLYV